MVTTLVHWLYQAQTVTSPDPSHRLHGTWRRTVLATVLSWTGLHQCWCKCRSFCCFNICCNQGTFELWYWYTTKNLVYKNKKTSWSNSFLFHPAGCTWHITKVKRSMKNWNDAKVWHMPAVVTSVWACIAQRDDNGEHNLGCTTPFAPWQLEQSSVVQFSVDGARAELDKELRKLTNNTSMQTFLNI